MEDSIKRDVLRIEEKPQDYESLLLDGLSPIPSLNSEGIYFCWVTCRLERRYDLVGPEGVEED